jgi:alkylation response protein AidB-like acyl-CoA dehydrogenase
VLTELGVPALLIAEEHGGIGLGALDAAIVSEALGYHATPNPFVWTAVMAAAALGADDSANADLLSAIVTGSARIGIAFGEAIGARGDAGVAVRGDAISGTSLFAFDAAAEAYLVADPSQHLFLVRADAAGLQRKHLTTVDKTRRTVELTYNDTPATRISDDPEVFLRALDLGRVMLAADTLGAAQYMLDQAVAYARERHQFGRPIATFQAVKHMCAEMAAHLEPCRAMTWFAAHALTELPDEARLTVCHTKAHLAEVGRFVAKTATEVHGGMGFTDLLGLHYWFKRCGANRQWLGAPELVREEAAVLQGLA